MQRQTGLLLALSVMPRYLFLDETFDGLDIAKRQMLTKILKNYTSRRNALVIVTSHYLNELEHIADEIGMIDGDRLIVPDTRGGSLESYFLEKARWMKMKSNVSSTEKFRGFSKKKDEKDGASRSKNKDSKRRDGNSGSGILRHDFLLVMKQSRRLLLLGLIVFAVLFPVSTCAVPIRRF